MTWVMRMLTLVEMSLPSQVTLLWRLKRIQPIEAVNVSVQAAPVVSWVCLSVIYLGYVFLKIHPSEREVVRKCNCRSNKSWSTSGLIYLKWYLSPYVDWRGHIKFFMVMGDRTYLEVFLTIKQSLSWCQISFSFKRKHLVDFSLEWHKHGSVIRSEGI